MPSWFDTWFLTSDLGKVATQGAKKLVFETEHPYSHNADRKQTVRIEGAKKLIVTFDDRSRYGTRGGQWAKGIILLMFLIRYHRP